eukprot:6339449-Amphidinium_carterae.1
MTLMRMQREEICEQDGRFRCLRCFMILKFATVLQLSGVAPLEGCSRGSDAGVAHDLILQKHGVMFGADMDTPVSPRKRACGGLRDMDACGSWRKHSLQLARTCPSVPKFIILDSEFEDEAEFIKAIKPHERALVLLHDGLPDVYQAFMHLASSTSCVASSVLSTNSHWLTCVHRLVPHMALCVTPCSLTSTHKHHGIL